MLGRERVMSRETLELLGVCAFIFGIVIFVFSSLIIMSFAKEFLIPVGNALGVFFVSLLLGYIASIALLWDDVKNVEE